MILIVCVDERNGMMFNNRRQSRDKILTGHIIEKTKEKKLWITTFSKDIFNIEEDENIMIDDNFYSIAEKEDYCFIENIDANNFIDKVDKIIIYNWNKHYPADRYFNINLNNWEIISEENFEGYSHENITEKIFVRREK